MGRGGGSGRGGGGGGIAAEVRDALAGEPTYSLPRGGFARTVAEANPLWFQVSQVRMRVAEQLSIVQGKIDRLQAQNSRVRIPRNMTKWREDMLALGRQRDQLQARVNQLSDLSSRLLG